MSEQRSPQEINAEILSRLDVAAEYEALGVRLRGQPRASGMVSAFAYGRDDHSPSAWINIRSGCYGDSGGRDSAAYTMSLWDFAVKAGKFPDWKAARKAYAEKAGVKIGREKQEKSGRTDWRKDLLLQGWNTPGNDVLAAAWCLRKEGVTVESIKAAGGVVASHPVWTDKQGVMKPKKDAQQVIAIPAYGAWMLDAPPVAYVIWNVSGQQFDVTPHDAKPTDERIMVKMKSIGPTSGTMMGLSSLMSLCDQERRNWIKAVWKVEGPADMLALWSAIPPDERENYPVVTSAGGATSDVLGHQVKILAGLRVFVVGDRDEAGQAGALKWATALQGIASEVRLVDLPWVIERSHGKDVRDYLNGEAA